MTTKTTEITCVTYGEAQTFKTRKEAIKFFDDCIRNSEGSEQERYVNVLLELMDGKTYCTDGE